MQIEFKELQNHFKGTFYTDDKSAWEPFENYSDEQIQEFIDNEAYALASFLASKGVKIID